MTPKERVIAAINLKTPDKIPSDLGTTICTSIAKYSYNGLKKLLNVSNKPDVLLMEKFNISKVDEEVLECLETDTRGIIGKLEYYPKKIIDERTFIDHFGCKHYMDDSGLYYNIIENPLADMETIEEIKEYLWPDPVNYEAVEGLKKEAKRLHIENKYAIVGDMNDTGIFEPSWFLRGFENFLIDLAINKDIALYIMERMLEFQKKRYELFLNEVGEYLDIVFVGDDLATSTSTIISPEIYREMVKPLQKEYFAFIKSKTNAKLLYHSCGDIVPFIEDLIECGVDILNPIQINAKGMNSKELKREFGDRICFWGGIDTSYILPNGTTEEVKREVEKRVEELGPNGYVGCAVHDIQADVPPENIVTMYKTFKEID